MKRKNNVDEIKNNNNNHVYESLRKDIKKFEDSWFNTDKGRRGDAIALAIPLLLRAEKAEDVLTIFGILNEAKFMHNSDSKNTDRNRKHIIENGRIVKSSQSSTSSIMHFITECCKALIESFKVKDIEERGELLSKPLYNLRHKISKDYSSGLEDSIDLFVKKLTNKSITDKSVTASITFFNDEKDFSKKLLVNEFRSYIKLNVSKYLNGGTDIKYIDSAIDLLWRELDNSSQLNGKYPIVNSLYATIEELYNKISSMTCAEVTQKISDLKKDFNVILADILVTEYNYSPKDLEKSLGNGADNTNQPIPLTVG